MRNEESYKLELSKNTYRAITTLANPKNIDVEKFILDCIEDYKLFEKDDEGYFYSKSFLDRMNEYERKRSVNRSNGRLGGRPRTVEENPTETETKPNGFENETEKNQNKIKENKVKENKRNKKDNFIPPTLNEIQDYVKEKNLKNVNAKDFLTFFTKTEWIDTNGKKVENWKLKLLTWDSFGENRPNKAREEPKKAVNMSNYNQRQYNDLNMHYANKGGSS